MQTIYDLCVPRDEVLKGELREDIFAARLKDVMDDRAELVYRDPSVFFDNKLMRCCDYRVLAELAKQIDNNMCKTHTCQGLLSEGFDEEAYSLAETLDINSWAGFSPSSKNVIFRLRNLV